MPKTRVVPGIGEANFPDTMTDAQIDDVVLAQSEKHFSPMIIAAAKELGVDPELAVRMARRESKFNPQAVSKKGAQGLFQLMPDTAAELGVTDPFDPGQNIRGGLSYYKRMLDAQGGDVPRALAAYNWGSGNLARKGMAAAPPETLEYIKALQGGGQATGVATPTPANAPESPRQPPIGPAIGPAMVQGIMAGVETAGAPEPPPPPAPAGERYMGGVGQGFYRAGRAFGLPQALHAAAPGVFPSAEEGAKWYGEQAQGTAGTLGDVTSSVVSAVPVMRAGAAMIPQALQAARPYLTSAILGAGSSAAMTPGGVEERGRAGATGGVLGPALTAAGRAVTMPMVQNKLAQMYQAATGAIPSALTGGGPVSRWVGQVAKSIPLLGQRGDPRMVEEATKTLWQRATPPGATVLYKGGPIQGQPYRELAQQFDDAYVSVLRGKQMPVDAYDRAQLTDIVNTNLVGDHARAVHRFLMNQRELQGNRVTGEQWKDLHNKFAEKERDFLSGDATQREVGRVYQQLRTYLNNIRNRDLSVDEINRLTGIDDAYSYRMLLQGAASQKGAESGVTSQMLEKTMRARASDEALARGTAQGQDVIGPLAALTHGGDTGVGYLARRAAYTALPVGLGGIAAGLTGAAALPAALAGYAGAAGSGLGSRIAFGQTAPQQALARLLRLTPSPAPGLVTQTQE